MAHEELKDTTRNDAQKQAWNGRSRGGAFGHAVMVMALRLFGLRVVYIGLHAIVFYFLLFAPGSRRNLNTYYQRLGRNEKGLLRWRRDYRHFLVFAKTLVDRVELQLKGVQAIDIETENPKLFLDAVGQGRGAVLLSAHLGNFQLGAAALQSVEGVKVNAVMMDNEAAAIKRSYKKLMPGQAIPINIIPINKGEFPTLSILGALRRGEIVALHGDRHIGHGGEPARFLGAIANFPSGAFAVAAAAKCPVIIAFGIRDGFRRYRFITSAVEEHLELPRKQRKTALAKYTRWYVESLEGIVKRYPEQWYNFYPFWATSKVPNKD